MEVRINSTLRDLCGERAVTVDLSEGETVRDALAATVARLPALSGVLLNDDSKLTPNVIVFLDGRNIRFFDGLDTVLQPDQVLSLFPLSGAQRALAAE